MNEATNQRMINAKSVLLGVVSWIVKKYIPKNYKIVDPRIKDLNKAFKKWMNAEKKLRPNSALHSYLPIYARFVFWIIDQDSYYRRMVFFLVNEWKERGGEAGRY
jgi:hypothetical protein